MNIENFLVLDEYEKIPNIATAKHIPAIISIRSS
jgi:hypothetical protein